MKMNKFKVFFIFFTVFLVLFVIPSPSVFAGNDDGKNEGTYYFGYGDSITAGKGTPDYCFSCSYIERMRVIFDPGKTSDHIGVEGGGNKVSYDHGPAWDENDEHSGGTRYYYHWTNTNNKYFIFMLGINDASSLYWHKHENGEEFPADENFSVANYTTGMLKIYNETLENGTIPIMCNPTGGDGADIERYPGLAFENYSRYYKESFKVFKNYSIKCVPMWDAVDINPWDGIMQPFDVDSFQGSGVHPNQNGHDAMANMLWYFINNWDYSTKYYPKNNTLIVRADYNQTIFINNTDWDDSTLYVAYMNNKTNISHSLQTDFFGFEKIRFDIIKGEYYIIKDANSTNFGLINSNLLTKSYDFIKSHEYVRNLWFEWFLERYPLLNIFLKKLIIF